MAARCAFLLLALLQTIGRLGWVRSVEAITDTRPTASRHLEVVFGGAPMPPEREASAMRELGLIWSPYGVDVHVQGASAIGSDNDARLFVTLVDRQATHAASEMLGSIAFVGNVPQPSIAIYPNAIDALLSSVTFFSGDQHSWPSSF